MDLTVKIKKLLERVAELRAQEDAIFEEISTLLGGGVGMGIRMKAGYQSFSEAWESRYPGGKYVWMFKRDAPAMKRLIVSIGHDGVAERAARYVQNDDPWLVMHRHPFGAFVSQINQYAPKGNAPVVGDLDLEDDAQATQRHLRELRGR